MTIGVHNLKSQLLTLLYVRCAGEMNGAIAAGEQEKASCELQTEEGVNGEYGSRVLLSLCRSPAENVRYAVCVEEAGVVADVEAVMEACNTKDAGRGWGGSAGQNVVVSVYSRVLLSHNFQSQLWGS